MIGDERAARIETAVDQLLKQVGGIPCEQQERVSKPGGWSIVQVLAHVAELLPYWSHQARAVAGRLFDDQPFGRTHDDPDRIAAVEAHAHDDVGAILPRIRAALTEAAADVRAIPAAAWRRTGRHARRGEMTVEQLVDQFLVEHLEEHTQQVEAMLRDAERREDVR